MSEHLYVDKWGENVMVKDYNSRLGLTVKSMVFFNDGRTGGVEVHYDCEILNTHRKLFLSR